MRKAINVPITVNNWPSAHLRITCGNSSTFFFAAQKMNFGCEKKILRSVAFSSPCVKVTKCCFFLVNFFPLVPQTAQFTPIFLRVCRFAVWLFPLQPCVPYLPSWGNLPAVFHQHVYSSKVVASGALLSEKNEWTNPHHSDLYIREGAKPRPERRYLEKGSWRLTTFKWNCSRPGV